MKFEQELQKKLSTKELEIGRRDSEIERLKAQLAMLSQTKELELKAELAKKEQEIAA